MNHWTQANTGDFAYSISLDFFTQLDDQIEKSGITRKELADKLEVTPSAVSQTLNTPPENPHLETCVQYARRLGLKVALVAYDDGDPDNDKGPIFSGIFEKAWEALGRPRDLSIFTGSGATANDTNSIVPRFSGGNKPILDEVSTKQLDIKIHTDVKNVMGDSYGQKAYSAIA
jgi:transcriptional regulator with XRE-family HTH domain